MPESSPKSVVICVGESNNVELDTLVLAEFYPSADGNGMGLKKRSLQQNSWSLPVSKRARRTINPIKATVDQITRRIQLGAQRRDRKNPISLASGDATQDMSIPRYQPAMDAVARACAAGSPATSYNDACGTPAARQAIAQHHSYPEVRTTSENVIVTNGCSGALNLVLGTLLDEDSTVLVPQPGFPLYEEIARSIGARVVHYHLRPNKDWECDMSHLETLMATYGNVRTIVINNPSSSTGAVFSECHLLQLVRFAARHRLPIISDEIYGDMVFGESQFLPMAQIAARYGREVPVITASGLSKQFLVPGWRLGWLCFNDNIYGSLREIQAAAQRMAQLNHGTSNLAQAAIAPMLDSRSPSRRAWKDNLKRTLEQRATMLYQRINKCPGLHISIPQGAMYAMVQVDPDMLGVEHDMELSMRLVDEENVFVLPGTALGVRNVIRVSYSCSENILDAALGRIESFCRRHGKKFIQV